MYDILNRRNELLSGIKSNTSKIVKTLKDIRGDTSTLPEIKTILGFFVIEQREYNKEQREHIQRLEKILEKLDTSK